MDPLEQAHHELDRLQGIISRHEGHMVALRGWLLATLGGLLAAYYTENIDMDTRLMQVALLLVVALFLVLESRHVNLVEAVVDRASTVEEQIRHDRDSPQDTRRYDGPRVSEACLEGAKRKWPKAGMTFALNQPFYVVVVVIVLLTTVSLPSRRDTSAAPTVPQSVKK